ncbi:MAG: hypothetical protein LC114_02440 [Bryobacterales bacterium]|nr:hypothetical protein [Bryobacterales bacterium]
MIRFLWFASKGYRLRPWASPYLRWRVETYSGIRAESVTFREFWRFLWSQQSNLWRYLRWTSRMSRLG